MMIFIEWKLKKLIKKAAFYYKNRQANAVSDNQIAKEVGICYRIASIYDKNRFSKKFPHAKEYALEYYRLAASLNDVKATYIVGNRLLEEGKFWQALSNTHLQCKAHEKYSELYFREAFAYLEKADENNYPLAKRLLGLAYINGWGVEVQSEKGFKMVVDSIEQEGSWDKATDLFKELGLNKPEFFTALMEMRNKEK